MASLLAVAGATTTAVRLAKELERLGCINCRVVHTPAKISSGTCSYSVKLDENYFPLISQASSKKHIKLRGIFRETMQDGEYIYENIS